MSTNATKRILITGANKGIGLATVEETLASAPDTFVWLGSRNVQRGLDARQQLLETSPQWADRLEVVQIDVSDSTSVDTAAQTVAARFADQRHPLYAIVNNAGIGYPSSDLGEVLAVNVHGIHRVCSAFADLLAPDRGRIVNVTSAAGPVFVAGCSPRWQRMFCDPDVTWQQIEDLMERCLALSGGAEQFATMGLGDGSAYGLSKACANAYTLYFAAAHPNLRINACTPGLIETDLTRPMAEMRGVTPQEMGMKPPEAGTVSILFLLFGEPEGNGCYYGSDAVRSPLDAYRSPGDPPYTGD